jgi:glycosyltransferase involved in cell wall biosynthesis
MIPSRGHDERTRVLVAHPGAELYGSDRMLLESVTGLVAAHAIVTVALPTTGPLVDLLVEAGAKVVVGNAFVLRKRLLHPARWGTLLHDLVTGWASARRIIRRTRPDVVYVNTIIQPLWPILAAVRGIPVLTHVHEAEMSASRVIRHALYLPFRSSGAIVTNSRFSRQVLATVEPALAARSVVIDNGVPSPPAIAAPRESLEDAARVLFVGRLSPRKGADLAVKAIAVLRDRGVNARLEVVGDAFEGYEWFATGLSDEVDRLKIDDRVHLAGFHEDVWPFIGHCDILVVPSRVDEPFGNTAVEGILAARPTIVSDTSGLREATDGFASPRLVRPDDVGAIADAIEEATIDWTDRRRAAAVDAIAAAKRFAPTRYRERVVAEVLRLHASA